MIKRLQFWEITAEKIQDSFGQHHYVQAITLFKTLRTGDQVEVFTLLDDVSQEILIKQLDIETVADLFDRLEDKETLEAAVGLSIERLADILDEMEPDEAADLLGDLHPSQATLALDEMEDSEEILPLLIYDDQTAGGRMTTNFFSVYEENTAEDVINLLRKEGHSLGFTYYVFVKDIVDRLIGVIGLRELLVSDPSNEIKDIMDGDVVFVQADTDQEIVAQIMIRYNLSALPVVDHDKTLMGTITYDDILDVIQEEATEDIYRLASVSDSELSPESKVKEHLKGRLPWLFVNSGTALLASWVVSNFEAVIAQVAILAALQSIVAGLGGNASSQSIALIVRSLALGKINLKDAFPIILKEVFIGIIQGIVIGTIAGIGIYFWRGNVYLGLILGLSIMGNLIVAAFVGTLIPLFLKAIKMDPALASPVLVTAVTDSVGFLIFLSLATVFVTKLQ